MAKIAVFTSCLAIIAILIGLFFPAKSLFWYSGKKSRLNVLFFYSLLLFLSFVLYALTV